MANELALFREHARRMEVALHKPECPVKGQSRFSEDGRTACTGCVTDAERAEWKRQADEIDAYRRGQITT